MKGKAALKAARRREREAVEAKTSLEEEVARWKQDLTDCRRQLVEQDQLRTEIERLRAQAAAGTSDELERVRQGYAALVAEVEDLRKLFEKIRKRDANAMYRAIVALGGGEPALGALDGLLHRADGKLSRITDTYATALPGRAQVAILNKRAKTTHNPRRLRSTIEELVERELCPPSVLENLS